MCGCTSGRVSVIHPEGQPKSESAVPLRSTVLHHKLSPEPMHQGAYDYVTSKFSERVVLMGHSLGVYLCPYLLVAPTDALNN